MKNPAFQFYPADFIMGTSMMTAEETGGYIRLLCHQWAIGYIINKDNVLKQLTGVYDNDALQSIKDKFVENDDGNLINERLEAVRQNYIEHQKKQSENGKKGGRPKNPNETQTKPKQKPNDNPNHNPKESSSSSSSSSITIFDSLKKNNTKKNKHSFDESIYFENFELFCQDFDKTKTAIENPSIDKKKLYNQLAFCDPAKYQYSDWIRVAQNWYERNPKQYQFNVTSMLEKDPAYQLMTEGQKKIAETNLKIELQKKLISHESNNNLPF
jgi:uncharacterized protein YdaU (DUF1376 family)